MEHLTLTCKNHPQLRWSTKEIAWTPTGGYNGIRQIFYFGTVRSEGRSSVIDDNGVYVPECPCSAKDLILAPESAQPTMER